MFLIKDKNMADTTTFGNPLVRSLEKTYGNNLRSASGMVSMGGVLSKTMQLFSVLGIAFTLTWLWAGQGPASGGLLFAAMIGGLVLGLVIAFKQSCNPALIYSYSVIQGIFLSCVSRYFETQFPGIVLQAVIGVAGCFCAVLFLYKAKIIKPTQGFAAFMSTAIMGIALLYLVSIVGSFFGWRMPILHEVSPAGIALSGVIVVIASLSLVMDFKSVSDADGRIEQKYEWFLAFGLMVTIVWMYIEILRLLWLIRSYMKD